MCITCGCGKGTTSVDGVSLPGNAMADAHDHGPADAAGTVYTRRHVRTGGAPPSDR